MTHAADAYRNGLTRRTFLKSMAAFALTGVAAGTLASCAPAQNGASAADTQKIFRWGQMNPKQVFDMHRSNSSQCSTVAESIVESPLYWNEDNELVPLLLASMPTWSDDKKTLHCTLKKGLTFTNGAPLTSEDVKYTFTRMFTPETGAVNTYMYDLIDGAKDMLAGKTTELKGVVVKDDQNFDFVLTEPFAQFVNNLGISYAGIFPKEACEKAGKEWGVDGNLIGTGPYKIVSANDGKIVLEANKDWHKGTPALDGIEINLIDDPNTLIMAYSKGDLDACSVSASQLKQVDTDPKVKADLRDYHPLGTNFINLNLSTPELKDPRVREALSLAINRQEFVETMMNGSAKVCSCFLHPNIPGHFDDKGEFPYDPEKAKKLLEEAGATNLKLTAKTRNALDTQYLTAVQGYWKNVGVDLDLQRIDPGVWSQDWKKGNIQVLYMSWHPLYPDADNHMNSYFRSDNAEKKSSFYKNPEFDKLMTQARSVPDPKERGEIYKKADEILTWKDYGCLPLCWGTGHYAARPNVDMKIGNLIVHMNEIKMDDSKSDKK